MSWYSKFMYRKFLNNNPVLKERRRYLRNHATVSEKILWKRLQHSQLNYKFRRQYSFGNYIIDFYCPQKRLGIEVDGGVHLKQKYRDAYRVKTLELFDIKIIRFTNTEVNTNIEEVIQTIKEYL